jgi:hypothetical protein
MTGSGVVVPSGESAAEQSVVQSGSGAAENVPFAASTGTGTSNPGTGGTLAFNPAFIPILFPAESFQSPEETAASGARLPASSVASSAAIPASSSSVAPRPALVYTASLRDRHNTTTVIPSLPVESGTVVVAPRRQFVPGMYVVQVTATNPDTGAAQVTTTDFAWGVLAINSLQDRYRPGETAILDIGVLDDDGMIVCDADLSLTITAPSGTVSTLSIAAGTIQRTGTCGQRYGGLTSPDYLTSFQASEIGIYNLFLEATTKNGVRSVRASIPVETAPRFIVTRSAATRLWPFAPSPVGLSIQFMEDFTGVITETVPSSFMISNVSPDADVFVQGDVTMISWKGSWTSGQTAELRYSFDAPDESPQFFLAGPLTLSAFSPREAAGGSMQTTWQEARSWQIANDSGGGPQTTARTEKYGIQTDVIAAGGGEAAKSNKYFLNDTIGEANIGEGETANYILNAGYRQMSDSASFLSLSCSGTVTLPNISGAGGTSTNSGTCLVATDSYAGYTLSWGVLEPTSGLVGHWKLDETSGTNAADSTSYENDGTYGGSPTPSTTVPLRDISNVRSLNFNGSSDYVNLPTGLMNGLTQWTVSGWVKADSLADNVSPFLGSNAANGLPAIRYKSGGYWQVYAWDGAASIISDLRSNYAPQTGVWYHLVVTFDGSTGKLYSNGVDVSSGGSFSALTLRSDTTGVRIGGGATTSANAFDGLIDDVRIYNRALSAAEIRQLSSDEPATMLSENLDSIPGFTRSLTGGLVGYWRMDEVGGGSTVKDSSGNGNDGTPNGTGGANNLPQPNASVPSGINFGDYRSLGFDGTDDYVDVADHSSLSLTTAFSVAAWIKLDTLPASGKYPSIAAKLEDYKGYGLFWHGAGSPQGVGGILGKAGAWSFTSTHTPTVGVWTHYAAVYDGAYFRLYLNGTQHGTPTPVSGSVATTANPLRMGKHYGSDSYGFLDGTVDDVRVYNRGLSAAEVKALASQPQPWSILAADAAYGARLSSLSTDTNTALWGTNGGTENWLAVGDGSYPFVRRNSRTTDVGSREIIQYRAQIGSNRWQPTGSYQAPVTITAVAL